VSFGKAKSSAGKMKAGADISRKSPQIGPAPLLMEWVLDSSVALALSLPDEKSEEVDVFFNGLGGEDRFWVPALWWYEIANALISAQRRKRLAEADRNRLPELFRMLPIQTDTAPDAEAMYRFQSMAIEHGLSASDAAYLELAQRRGIGLATLDQRLRSACAIIGIHIYNHSLPPAKRSAKGWKGKTSIPSCVFKTGPRG
jgi:predicted nucleic acid-binding protein